MTKLLKFKTSSIQEESTRVYDLLEIFGRFKNENNLAKQSSFLLKIEVI